MGHKIGDLNTRYHASVAYKEPNLIGGFSCGEDIPTGHAVKMDPARDGVVMIAGAGEGFGVAHEGNGEGCELEVAICCGGACVVLGGTVAAGDPLISDADGKFIKASSGDWAIGLAIAKGVLDDRVEIIMQGCLVA